MKHTHALDVLVVYTDEFATSAADTSSNTLAPFSPELGKENYNGAYAHLLTVCKRMGLSAGFSTTKDITGAGACISYWIYLNGEWQRVLQPVYCKQIFDKFAPLTKQKKLERDLLFSSSAVQPFTDPILTELFIDKLATYKKHPRFGIPTVAITSSNSKELDKAISSLRVLTMKYHSSQDFSESIIVKDRYGAGGNYIFKVDSNFSTEIAEILKKHSNITFVLQPFLQFEHGFSYKQYHAATDIRLIFHNGKLLQTYIRMAKASDFRCNEHQGGTVVYVSPSDIPPAVRHFAQALVRELKQPNSLYALDFIVSNRGHVYFLEGNIAPGIYWAEASKQDERMSKQLILVIVKEFVRRIKFQTIEAASSSEPTLDSELLKDSHTPVL